jgi:hypothetical protein
MLVAITIHKLAKFVVDSIFDVIVSTKEASEVLLVSKV